MTNLAPIHFFYKNHRGEREERHVVPESIEFDFKYHGEYHPQPEWILNGFCLDRQARRSFLFVNIIMPMTVEEDRLGRKIEEYSGLKLDFKVATSSEDF